MIFVPVDFGLRSHIVYAKFLVCFLILASVAAPAIAQHKMGEYTVESELPRLPVLQQGRTGTCWCFATTSFLETELQRMHKKPIDLSEIYTVRHTIVEKAKNYVAKKGKAPFGEGGLSHDVIAMAREYGLMPQSAYTGLPEGQRTHNHGKIFREIKGLIKGFAKGDGQPTPKWVEAASAIVDSHLGATPKTFKVDGRKMTAQQYATDYLKIPFNDYIEVMSYSYAPFHKNAKLTVRDNWMGYDKYHNVPIDEFMEIFNNALATGYSVAVDIDVSEKTYRPRDGIGLLTEELEKKGAVTQAVRDEMFKTKKTTDDHLLHIVGVAKKDGKRYYITKDSWGKNHGKLNGYRMLSENYIRGKVLAFMIHKDGMPKSN
ncbi:MAG: aminopeptidase [Planctomycetes bacterium]|nr:aminopeptidase [Planctomycetota bacterium]